MVKLIIAPAAGGKTAYALNQARRSASGLQAEPRVVLTNRLDVQAWRKRLAQAGGGAGIRAGTFDDLYRQILVHAGHPLTLIGEPVQKRLIRSAVQSLPLRYFGQIKNHPGFIDALADLIRELKAGMILPRDFAQAVRDLDGGNRLPEMAEIYRVYQQQLENQRFLDFQGAGWAAARILAEKPGVGQDWPLVIVDGFDDFNPLQARILQLLAPRVDELLITLTGEKESGGRRLPQERFDRTRRELVKKLDVQVEFLKQEHSRTLPAAGPGQYLAGRVFSTGEGAEDPGERLRLLAVPDRETEVREALRWIKTLLVRKGLELEQCAVLCRNLEPYRPYLDRIGTEFGLPLTIAGGLPLEENPAVAAVIDLLRLMKTGEERLAWRGVVEAWRSPYFDWEHASPPDEEKSIGIGPGDAEVLAWVARWGSVISGEAQWKETFQLLAGMEERPTAWDEEYPEVPDRLPVGEQAESMGEVFQRFAAFIQPPRGKHTLQDFTRWLENLLGEEDPELGGGGLAVVSRVNDGPP